MSTYEVSLSAGREVDEGFFDWTTTNTVSLKSYCKLSLLINHDSDFSGFRPTVIDRPLHDYAPLHHLTYSRPCISLLLSLSFAISQVSALVVGLVAALGHNSRSKI